MAVFGRGTFSRVLEVGGGREESEGMAIVVDLDERGGFSISLSRNGRVGALLADGGGRMVGWEV